MLGRKFHNQKGEFSLPLAIVIAMAAGIGVKVAMDKLGNDANVVFQSKQGDWVDNAINAAVVRAESLLKPVQTAGVFQKGHIIVSPRGSVRLTENSQFNLEAGTSPAVDWQLQDAATLRLTMVGMGGASLNADQVVTLFFKSPIIKRSPIEPAIFVLRGFEVDAVAQVTRKDGSTFTVRRPKTVAVDLAALGGCGSGCGPAVTSETACRVVGPSEVIEPNTGATASLIVNGPALTGNVPRLSSELNQAITNRGETLRWDGRTYTIPAGEALFKTRFVGAMSSDFALSEKNDINLEDPERVYQNGDKEWSFSFTTPRPLTAVDAQGTITFPMWATIQLPDGSWKACSPGNVRVRQVTSCEFLAPSSPHIDNGQAQLNLTAEDYSNFASTLTLKGYDVPGCEASCSDYKDQRSCGQRNNNCYWHAPQGNPNGGLCYFRDFRQSIACSAPGGGGQFAASPTGATVVAERNNPNIPSSTNIRWRIGQGGAGCQQMKVYLTMAENSGADGRPVYYYRNAAGNLRPIPTRPLRDSDYDSPLPSEVLDRNGKLVGFMPQVVGNVGCAQSQFQVSAESSQFIPRGRYAVWGSLRTAQGSGSCLTNVWVGADTCSLTNTSGQTGQASFRFSYQGSPARTVTGSYNTRQMIESEGVAYNPFTSVNCTSRGERCFYYPAGSGPAGNRTAFVRLINPERSDASIPSRNPGNCEFVGVDRIDLGCFLEGSKIMMGDGTWKDGELVQKGDYVWNPVAKMAVRVAETTNGPEKHPIIRIETLAGKVIKVTRNHPMPTKTGLKAAKDLLVGDDVLVLNGDYTRVTAVGLESSKEKFVWNLRLDGDSKDESFHYVLVDGIVAGDLTLQEQLETAFKVTAKDDR
jgi:hypothetical protein